MKNGTVLHARAGRLGQGCNENEAVHLKLYLYQDRLSLLPALFPV